MSIKLDLKDKKLLALLDENARYSNSQLARRIGLSKPAVEYRLKRFEKNKAIFEFYTIINFTKLGYSQYKLYFKFQDTTMNDEKKMIDHWTGSANSIWVAQIRGRWDLTVSVLARNNFEFGRMLSDFMNKHSKFILEKDVLLTEYSPVYAREYIAESKPSEFIYGIPSEIYQPDEADKKIMKALATDARMHIIELSKKTGLTRDMISYRMKKLVKEKIIVQHRCYLDLPLLGINQYKIIFRTKNLDSNEENRIRQYVASHKKATQMLKLIGSWDLEIEFETENEDELYRILNDIRKEFSGIIRDFDILRITETYKYDYYPFKEK